MTLQDRIDLLDKAIIECSSKLSGGGSDGDTVKRIAINALQQINAEQSVISAVENVYFARNDLRLGGGLLATQDIRLENQRVAYRQSVQSIIGVLQQERERLKNEQQAIETKKNHRIQILTLIFSAIAAIGTLLSFIF